MATKYLAPALVSGRSYLAPDTVTQVTLPPPANAVSGNAKRGHRPRTRK